MGVATTKKIRCGCGTIMDSVLVTVKWQSDGNHYTISGVPSLQCTRNGCEEVYYSGKVEFNLSILAEEMEKGKLQKNIVYDEKRTL